MPTVEAANSAVGTFSLILFIGSTLYLVWMFQKFFKKKDSQLPEELNQIGQKGNMKNFLASERFKWIFVIGLVAIGSGFTAKNVISYPTECIPDKAVDVSMLIRPLE